ncbi:MAG TPA: hypothetical protein VHK22_10470 [Gaiellaceae bacterium]|jgi:hypothetical protein|nr:hypothetical protein [Gaiellaceae bacterium]
MSTNQPEASEWHLARAFEHEVVELAHHPRREIHRLREEADRGESGITLAIILTVIAVAATLITAVVLTIVWVSAGGL